MGIIADCGPKAFSENREAENHPINKDAPNVLRCISGEALTGEVVNSKFLESILNTNTKTKSSPGRPN